MRPLYHPRNPFAFNIINRKPSKLRPAVLPGMSLWLRADSGVYADAGKTTPASAGGPVGCWADVSGNGADATQAAAARMPTLTASALNGLPAVTFDGVDDLLRLTRPVPLPAFTVFLVLRMPDDAQGIALGSSSQDTYYFYRYTNGTDGTLYFNDGTNRVGTPIPSLNSYALVELQSTGSAWRAFVNGAQVGDDQPLTAGAGSELGVIGSWAEQTYLFPGPMAEVIAYGSALGADDRRDVETYLNTRYRLF